MIVSPNILLYIQSSGIHCDIDHNSIVFNSSNDFVDAFNKFNIDLFSVRPQMISIPLDANVMAILEFTVDRANSELDLINIFYRVVLNNITKSFSDPEEAYDYLEEATTLNRIEKL